MPISHRQIKTELLFNKSGFVETREGREKPLNLKVKIFWPGKS